MKTLFIVCASVQAAFFILSLVAERYLRHSGRLPRNMRVREKVFSGFAIFFSIPGQIGIILVAVFDSKNHSHTHFSMLILFIVCIGISCMCTIAEFFYLDNSYSGVRRLRVSYFFKLLWLIVAVILAIGFAVCNRTDKDNVAAVFEWFLAFFYGIYLLILAYDLLPAFTDKNQIIMERNLERRISRAVNWVPGAPTEHDLETEGGQPPLNNAELDEKAVIGDMVYQNRKSYYDNTQGQAIDGTEQSGSDSYEYLNNEFTNVKTNNSNSTGYNRQSLDFGPDAHRPSYSNTLVEQNVSPVDPPPLPTQPPQAHQPPRRTTYNDMTYNPTVYDEANR